jgi:hypothetical protein
MGQPDTNTHQSFPDISKLSVVILENLAKLVREALEK